MNPVNRLLPSRRPVVDRPGTTLVPASGTAVIAAATLVAAALAIGGARADTPGTAQAVSPPTPGISPPPYVAPPADAEPVMVLVELHAKDGDALAAYLESAPVIPLTRLASGIRHSWSTRGSDEESDTFYLTQGWNSRAQHAAYIDWRVETGALDELVEQLSEAPVVTYLDAFDTDTLPARAARTGS